MSTELSVDSLYDDIIRVRAYTGMITTDVSSGIYYARSHYRSGWRKHTMNCINRYISIHTAAYQYSARQLVQGLMKKIYQPNAKFRYLRDHETIMNVDGTNRLYDIKKRRMCIIDNDTYHIFPKHRDVNPIFYYEETIDVPEYIHLTDIERAKQYIGCMARPEPTVYICNNICDRFLLTMLFDAFRYRVIALPAHEYVVRYIANSKHSVILYVYLAPSHQQPISVRDAQRIVLSILDEYCYRR